MKYRKNVYQSLVMITQFGINMVVPIFMCTLAGVWIGEKWNIPIIVLPLFILGALAGFRNVYIMAKKIFEQESDRDTKYVKKTK
ncbi:MAG: AtpZ/AtpI family protein [Lachnospiraceae bacterium]|nr:AtpZ/AtpI family protein [Lachnospiraceae bacterium]